MKTQSTMTGWTKIARKHYRHENGMEVRYDCNRWGWEVIGAGPNDGNLYGPLWVAMQAAADTPARWVKVGAL